MQPFAPLPAGPGGGGGAQGKENVTPPLQLQQADASGIFAMLMSLCI